MRLMSIIILNFCFHLLYAEGYDYNSHDLFPGADTVPPPPPVQAIPLSGPVSACVGDTSEYHVDVPVACTCQWAINNTIQTATGPFLTITWTQPGLQVVSVVFICAGGQTSDPQTISVVVFETPSQPQPISGDDYVCEYTYHTYSTIVGPYDSCEWSVNGVIQPGYSPSVTYSFGGAGTYLFEVIAFNPCGISIPQTLEVTVQGAAPATPSPVQGSEESCEEQTEIYTTAVGPGESCAWWVDGALQPSTTDTLEVTWHEWGNHLIEVRAVSDCGTGNPALKNILVMYQPAVLLGNDTTILQGQMLILDAGNPGCDYLWSTGDMTRTLPVSVTGMYAVNVFNFCGVDADTIEVSVIVGIMEYIDPGDCFRVIVHEGKISFPGLTQDAAGIQVVDLNGVICYDGPPGEITVARPGIYIIRLMTPETTCYRKIFIP